MPLLPGTKLRSYEILSLAGGGGMGEVYRARDTRLGRDVAIKVLPAEKMADEDRRRRLIKEARAASALDHPNIVTIHEIESVEGMDFIVMELVAGKTLDLLIPPRGMKLDQVLRLAIPMADALARAHGAGIVHRDLKPTNVMVSDTGLVKVLDFGLAKLVPHPASTSAVTDTRDEADDPASRSGVIAGTVGYMSPEQAAGRTVDARSDVFSFGAVLYQMVTGRRAFRGDSAAEVQAALIKEQPTPVAELVPDVPRDLERVIERCLRKEADRRFQHMADVRLELEEIQAGPPSKPVTVVDSVAGRGQSLRRVWLIVPAFALALALSFLAWRARQARGPTAPPFRVVPLTAMRGFEEGPTFSPDGGQVAFSWSGENPFDPPDIYVKMIGSSEIHRLTTDPAWDRAPSWSPDGRQIAFLRVPAFELASGTIHLVSPIGGGSERKLSDFPVSGQFPPSWSRDGQWLAVAHEPGAAEDKETGRGLYLVSVRGETPRRLTQAPPLGDDVAPALSWDGHRLAYASCLNRNGLGPCDVYVLDLGTDLRPAHPPTRLTRQGLGIHGLAWARNDASIVYQGYVGMELGRLWRVDVDGGRPPERLELAGDRVASPTIAPSGDRLAYTTIQFNRAIFRFEAEGPGRVLLASSLSDGMSQFSPDGRRLVFESLRSGETSEVWLAASDGSNPVQLTHGPGRWQGSPYWSPDGGRIAFDSQGPDGRWDIWTIGVDGASPRQLTQDAGDENRPTFSRDGRWVYFTSARSGVPEIWRVPAAGGVEEQVTHGGAEGLALESPDGRELVYKRSAGSLALLSLPLAGGAERPLVKCVSGEMGFGIAAGLVYHFGCDQEPALHTFDPKSGRDRTLGKLKGPSDMLTVSPDGATVLYTYVVNPGSDLKLIENFR